ERYMLKNKLLNDKNKKVITEKSTEKVEKAVEEYEKVAPPQPEDMFKYTYAQMPDKLQEQMKDLKGE
ncbi:MAG TPA: hypothetical protein ACFYEM_03850, partial [Candidatus Hypogeohydataceae bacterium YC40]